jgi:hypothetical protein
MCPFRAFVKDDLFLQTASYLYGISEVGQFREGCLRCNPERPGEPQEIRVWKAEFLATVSVDYTFGLYPRHLQFGYPHLLKSFLSPGLE